MNTSDTQKTPETRQKHVLLIDDDTTLLRLFGGYLEKGGFQVIYAHDGNEGREMARRLQPDIILLDLTLPVLDGDEVSRMLKNEDLTKDIPLIILTNADVSQEAQMLFKERGAADYLHKSVQEDELIQRVNAVISAVKK